MAIYSLQVSLKTYISHQRTNSFWMMALQFASILVLTLLLTACQRQEQPTDSLPADLQVSARLDSFITVDRQGRFSQLAPVGEGPRGALIRLNYKSSIQNQSFTTFTYTEQQQLVGMFDYNEGYNQQTVSQAQYQQGLLATVWMGAIASPPWAFPRSPAYLESLTTVLDTLQPYQLTTYQYNQRKQVARTLSYQRIGRSDGFRLEELCEFVYSTGSDRQLQQTRVSYRPGPGPRGVINHWQEGDLVRKEVFYTPSETNLFTSVTTTFQYGKEPNLFAGLSYSPQSRHTMISRTDNSGRTTHLRYTYQYDTQGRVVSRVLGDETGRSYWTGYSFMYAP